MSADKEPPNLRLVGTSDAPPLKPLTVEQRAALAKLLSKVFAMLRAPAYQYFQDRPEDWRDVEKLQAAVDRSIAFAEAFHNLPRFLFQEGFDFDVQETLMKGYIGKCPDLRDFMQDLRDIRNMGNPQ